MEKSERLVLACLLVTACRFSAAEIPLETGPDAPLVTVDAPLVAGDAPLGRDAPPDGAGAADARRFDARPVDARPDARDAAGSIDAPSADAGAPCDPPTGECDGDPQTVCETRLDSDGDCGACDRACLARGGTNGCLASGDGFDCAPECDGEHADCDGDRANGCELDIAGDLGEPDDGCPGRALAALDEGGSRSASRRILPVDDIDVFSIVLREGEQHLCTPGDPLLYTALVTLAPPPGGNFRLRELADATVCEGDTTNAGTEICFTWAGKCDLPAERTVFFKVDGAGDATSCTPYGVTVKFCRAGATCEECRQP